MRATKAALAAAVSIAGAGALLAPACSRTTQVVLDGVPRATAAALDRRAAAPAPDLRITSLGDGAVIPSNLAFPLVEWEGGVGPADAYAVEISSERATLEVVLKRTRWRPEGGEFERFLGHGGVTVTIYRAAGGRTFRSAPVRLRVAPRPLRERIAFRVVAPLFDPSLRNALMAFEAGRREPATLLTCEGTCIGCHAYAARSALLNLKRGGERRLVVAGPRAVAPTPAAFNLGPFSFLAPSPDGAHAVFVNAPVGDLVLRDTPVEPFDYAYRAGDLHVLDLRTGRTAPLAGAADPATVEDMPSFSPDGRRVVFSRYRFDPGDGGGRVPAMDLVEVPFRGGAGGEASPVVGASANGAWHYFARYAPNGRWMSFCRGDASHGVYARQWSDIYLLPLSGAPPRRMRLNADAAMDSWHSWSPDSHWLAFSSNRERSGMTALYLSYVDDDGNDYPPVKVAGFDDAKVNTPTFLPGSASGWGPVELAAATEAAFSER